MLENFDAYQIAKSFYKLCKSLKVHRFLQDQLLRASASGVLNLAEVSGSLRGLRECRAILEREEIADPELFRLSDSLSAILYVLSRKAAPSAVNTPSATSTVNPTDTDSDSASLPR